MKLWLLIAVLACGPMSAFGQIKDVRWQPFDSSYAWGAPFPDRFFTSDLLLDFTGQYTGSQVFLELTAGHIVNLSNGLAPDDTDVLNPPDPRLYADTAFLNGGDRVSTGSGLYSLGGGAVGIGGDDSPSATSVSLDQAWNPASGNFIFDKSDFLVLRLSLTPDAQGEVTHLHSADNQIDVFQFPIVNGRVVPEPVTASCLFAGLMLLRRRG